MSSRCAKDKGSIEIMNGIPDSCRALQRFLLKKTVAFAKFAYLHCILIRGKVYDRDVDKIFCLRSSNLPPLTF